MRKFFEGANPFAGINGIADTINAAVGSADIGLTTKYRKVKKTGASACANAPVVHQVSNKLSIDSTAWVVHHLLNLELVFWHY